jgi:lipopolysaccharide/colanic/teichoic acid biosynthesis glycosyltransferase
MRQANRPGRSAFPPYRGKRVVDWLSLLVVGVPALALGAVCAVAVRLTSKGPILFRQERIGMDGQPFEVLKFRTMVAGDNPIFPDATRITSAGRVLRRFSLDELPQLLNVARGDMSLVGPRPTLAYQVARYTDRQRLRLCVRPGLTGLAQVRGRNLLSWSQRIEYDVEYVQSQSIAVDVRIILGTIKVLLTGAGAEGHPTDDPLASTDDDGDDGDDSDRDAP